MALVSYTNLKLNGMLVRPDYYPMGNISGTEYTETRDVQTMYPFKDGKRFPTLNEPATVAIRLELKATTFDQTVTANILQDSTKTNVFLGKTIKNFPRKLGYFAPFSLKNSCFFLDKSANLLYDK